MSAGVFLVRAGGEGQPVIHFFIGTKAQFIKMAPVMAEMQSRQIPFRYVDSGQHAERTRSLRRVFGLAEPDVCLRGQAGDIVSIREAAGWYLKLRCRGLFRRTWLRRQVFPGGGICLIHGDTLSTLLGLQLARGAGLDVGHVEAGLRSFRKLDPFPEELIRVHCMRRSQVLFSPSEQATRNLAEMQISGRVVEVHGNTVADALRLMDGAPVDLPIPDGPFALATCHRLETITKKRRLGRVVDLLNRVAERMSVVLVIHKPTERYLTRFGLTKRLRPEITRMGMVDYAEFVALLRSARLVLTDGGSIQEECAYLNKPCLILRSTTERPDGVGANAAVWAFDEAAAEEFLSQVLSRPPGEPAELPRPSAEIADALVEMGYAP